MSELLGAANSEPGVGGRQTVMSECENAMPDGAVKAEVSEALARLPEAMRRNVWQPGQSGNPGGRPKGLLTAELRRQLLRNDAEKIRAIASTLIRRAVAGSIPAIQTVLERVDGKVLQTGEADHVILIPAWMKPNAQPEGAREK